MLKKFKNADMDSASSLGNMSIDQNYLSFAPDNSSIKTVSLLILQLMFDKNKYLLHKKRSHSTQI